MPVICGDCKEIVKRMDENSIDSIVTDPPAGINFMGRVWDRDKGGRDQWIEWMTGIATECLRVIKPGGHALVWSLPRTSHWTATAWEDGGFEVREVVTHIFGQGFPKSLDISKAIEAKILTGSSNKTQFKNLDGEKGIAQLGYSTIHANNDRPNNYNGMEYNKSVNLKTIEGKIWNGWGTALKPAHEDWILLRKPLEGTVAQNVLKWGVGGINIDGCRVEYQSESDKSNATPQGQCTAKSGALAGGTQHNGRRSIFERPEQKGRFPANLIHDGSDEVLALFPQSRGMSGGGAKDTNKNPDWVVQPFNRQLVRDEWIRCDSGSAARFFYCAKPSKSERNIGCENLPLKTAGECTDRVEGSAGLNSPRAGAGRTSGSQNDHPTVKSISLMRYLCKLITPPGGVVLDPFGGSGSTGIAAYLEGFQCIMIDKEPHFCEIAEARMKGIIKENNKS